jgi:Sec-independent protein translocase protein TatA
VSEDPDAALGSAGPGFLLWLAPVITAPGDRTGEHDVFDLSAERLFALTVVALFVLGPERLPGALRGVADAVRTVRDHLGAAVEQLRREAGPELDQLAEPLRELRDLAQPSRPGPGPGTDRPGDGRG